MIDISLTISEVVLASVIIVIAGAIVKPRAPGRWKKAVLPSVLMGVAAISLVGAATSLSISGTGSVTAKNWKGVTLGVLGTPPTCTASSGTYTDTPGSIAWGNVASPSSTNAYICVQNTDAATQSYTASSLVCSPTPCTPSSSSSGAFSVSTSPSGSTPVASGSFSLVTVTLTVTSGASSGTTFTTSTTIS